MLKGACYIRVSTDNQTEFSPTAQLKAIKNYAKNNDIELIKDYIFIDEGISGRKADKRPAFQEMIKIAKSQPKNLTLFLCINSIDSHVLAKIVWFINLY